MQEKSLNVYIITRFGLGQSQKSFYEREFIYLEKFLAKSIQNQKNYITKWIILIDKETPSYIYERITKLIPKNLLYVHTQNPFLTCSLKPNITTILQDNGVKLDDKIVTIRIDADDMLSNDYVENVLNTLKNKNLLNKYDKVLVDAATGVYFYLTKNKLYGLQKGFSIKLYIQFLVKFYVSL